MKSLHAVSLACALALGLVACGGGSPAEELANEQADIMAEMAGVVEGIDNGEDLADAKSEMKALASQMKAITQKWGELSKNGLTSEEMTAVVKDHARLNAASKRYSEAMGRLITNPALASQLNEMMQEMGNTAGR